jgi:hypothetical protein
LLLLSLTRDICICVTNGQLARQIQKNRGKKKISPFAKTRERRVGGTKQVVGKQ